MTDKNYIIAIDQSTSGTKALIIDRSGNIVGKSSDEHRQIYPRPDWVEHDPMEIYDKVKGVIRRVMMETGVSPAELAALTVTNQRETAVLWDCVTGLPVYNAIVWQCQRTADACFDYKSEGHETMIKAKTGLMLDPYFSASKWAWIFEHVPEAYEKLASENLLAGTMDSWLIWKLSGGTVHATDYSNASRTSLFNIISLEWDEELCSLFKIPMEILPEVKSSDDIFGYTHDPELLDGYSIPISGVIGDSQAALFGNQCFRPGMAKATFGTGTSVLMNVGENLPQAGNGLVVAIAWGISGRVTYGLEAVIRSSGDTLKWVRDNLGLFDTFKQIDELLVGVSSTEGVYLVPAFVGMGAPYWDPYARAAILGMHRRSSKVHIVRAALESMAYQVKDAVELMKSESGIQIQELHADGGATENEILMQFQADILNCQVVTSWIAELSALGSVYLGALGVGFWSSQKELSEHLRLNRICVPRMETGQREELYAGWNRAVDSVLHHGRNEDLGSGI